LTDNLNCTRFITTNETSGLVDYPCGQTPEDPCLGLSLNTTFFNLSSYDVICFESGDYYLPYLANDSVVLPIGVSLYALLDEEDNSTYVTIQPEDSSWVGTNAPIFLFSFENANSTTAFESTISGITFANFNITGPDVPSFIQVSDPSEDDNAPTSSLSIEECDFANFTYSAISTSPLYIISISNADLDISDCSFINLDLFIQTVRLERSKIPQKALRKLIFFFFILGVVE